MWWMIKWEWLWLMIAIKCTHSLCWDAPVFACSRNDNTAVATSAFSSGKTTSTSGKMLIQFV